MTDTTEPNGRPTPVARRPVGPRVRLWKRLAERRGVRHLGQAVNRFTKRLGYQFAAALTYFSFLAMVPILMVAFSIAGFVLSSQPDLLATLRADTAAQVPGALADTIDGILNTAIKAPLALGLIGLAVALYSGISWMGNLRSAIQALWRSDFDTDQEIAAESLLGYYRKSLRYLTFLGLAILASLTLTTAGSWAQDLVLGWIGLDKVGWLSPVFTVGPILLAIVGDVGVFFWVYSVLAPRHGAAPRSAVIRGSIAAALAFEILKLGLTLALPLLLRSTAARVFGPIIGLLIFFNLVALVTLFVAAWIATALPDTPTAPAHGRHAYREPDPEDGPVSTQPADPAEAPNPDPPPRPAGP
ncbi:MAG: YihY/virulence factor BrkB family protein [Actinomycetota bacterium]|nr:YihY/virulence factor BrkB family protein [Actinomycetota bacterium]